MVQRLYRCTRPALFGLLAAIIAAGAASYADDHGIAGGEHWERQNEAGYDHDEDYDEGDEREARGALRRGEVLSLDAILQRAQALLNGRMLEAELEREDGRWVYEITLLGPEGHVVEASFDARDATLLGLEGGALEKILKRLEK